MNLSDLTPRQHLLMALNHYGISILDDRETVLDLANDYSVEVEKGFLFKLYWRGTVVAPFNDLDELCQHVLASQ